MYNVQKDYYNRLITNKINNLTEKKTIFVQDFKTQRNDMEFYL